MTNVHFSSKTDDWATPQDLFDKLNEEFNFTTDVCASIENTKCKEFFTKEDNGLIRQWGKVNWMNPPYGRGIGAWIKKAYHMAHTEKCITVALLPARTDTQWFHDYIYGKAEIRLLKGRIKFGGYKYNAPFPSMIVIFN